MKIDKKTKAVAIAVAAGAAVLAVVYEIAHKVAPKAPGAPKASASSAASSTTPDAAPAQADVPTAPSSTPKSTHVTMAEVWHVKDADKHFVRNYYPNFGPFANKVFWGKNAKAAAAMYKTYGEHFGKGKTAPPMRSAKTSPADPHIVPGAEDPAFTPGAVTVPVPAAPPPLPDAPDGGGGGFDPASLQASMQGGANAGSQVIDAISTFGDTEPQS